MWTKKPITISNSNIDENTLIIGIDENGVDSYNTLSNSNLDQFTLTAVMTKGKKPLETPNKIRSLKSKHWIDGKWAGKEVVLHSRDIRKKQGPFNPKLVNHKELKKDIDLLIEKGSYIVYSVSINKRKMISKYSNPYPVYSLALEFILERIIMSIKNSRTGWSGILLLESRGIKKDTELHQEIIILLRNGNLYHSVDDFKLTKGIYFVQKISRKSNKSYWPLEIADIVSYEIHNYSISGYKSDRYKLIENKILKRRDGKVLSYKTFP